MVFSFGTMLIPIGVGIYLLATAASAAVAILLAAYILFSVVPSFFMRARLFCGPCRQGRLGCPALEGMRGKRYRR